MGSTITDVPSALAPPKNASRSSVRRAIVHTEFGRRTFMKGVFAAGMSIGLASLDLLPGGPSALARPSRWKNCKAYDDLQSNNLWIICNPCARHHPPRRKRYCNRRGFHRTDTKINRHRTVKRVYRRRHQSCAGKNTWRWRVRNGFGEPNPRNRKCSDGKIRYYVRDPLDHRNWIYDRTKVTVCMKYVKMNGKEKRAPHHNYWWRCGGDEKLHW